MAMAPQSTAPPPAEAVFGRVVVPRAPLYVLLDAAREPFGPYEAEQAGLECQSLFAGDLGDKLAEVAPYISEFPARASFRAWWFEQWGRSIGVLVESPASLAELRRHFRTLTVVRDAARKQYFFRFYDPRVLRVFLPACTPDELQRFFGPITHFYCEGDGGRELLTFSASAAGLAIRRSPVPAPDAARSAGSGAPAR